MWCRSVPYAGRPLKWRRSRDLNLVEISPQLIHRFVRSSTIINFSNERKERRRWSPRVKRRGKESVYARHRWPLTWLKSTTCKNFLKEGNKVKSLCGVSRTRLLCSKKEASSYPEIAERLAEMVNPKDCLSLKAKDADDHCAKGPKKKKGERSIGLSNHWVPLWRDFFYSTMFLQRPQTYRYLLWVLKPTDNRTVRARLPQKFIIS